MIPPFCKLKLIRFYFIFCKFYVADRGFGRELFLSYEKKPQHQLGNCLYYTPFGPSVVNVFVSLMLERQTPPRPLIRYKPYVKRGTSLA